MDKWLLKQLQEEERLNSVLPWLRNEYNALVGMLDKWKTELKNINDSKSSIAKDIDVLKNDLDKQKSEFDFYKKTQENIINKTLKDEQNKIYKLIEQEKQEKIELDAKRKAYNTDIVAFEEYKATENDKLTKREKEINTKHNENTQKEQFLSSEFDKLEAQKNKVALDTASIEKNIKLAQELNELSKKNAKIAKEEVEKMSSIKQIVDLQERELINKSQNIIKRENDVLQKEQEQKKIEIKQKDKQIYLDELEYRLITKEADLKIEEKRLILSTKQQKANV